MFIAKEKGTDHRVYIDDVLLEKEYICPNCHSDLKIETDGVMTPYFKHKTPSTCDTFSQDNSLWHKEWQNLFPIKNQEVILTLKPTNGYYLKSSKQRKFETRIPNFLYSVDEEAPLIIMHRADVCACGYVIKFQKDPISNEEFNEQNWFYTSCGKKIIWIFDFSKETTMTCYDKNKYSKKWQWESAPETFINYLPQLYRKHKDKYNVWKDSSILVFFQTTNKNTNDTEIIELVTWVIEKGKGEADFQRFTTSLNHVYTKKEFRESIVKQKF